jgi:hypothetical protein
MVEEISKDEFTRFSKEWDCQKLNAHNLFNSRQELLDSQRAFK